MKSCITLFVFVSEISPVVNSVLWLLVFNKSLFSSPSLWSYCCLTVKGIRIYFQALSVSSPLPWETRAYFLVFEFLVPSFWEPKGDKAAAVEPFSFCTGSGPSVRTVLLSHFLSAAQCRFRGTIQQSILGAHCIPFPGKNSLREKVKAAGIKSLQYSPCNHKGCQEIWYLLLFLD